MGGDISEGNKWTKMDIQPHPQCTEDAFAHNLLRLM